MSEERLYSFADISSYSFKQRIIIRSAGVALYWLIRVIGATVKFEIQGWENFDETKPQILCFWHNRIPIATYFWRHRKIIVMSSQSFDSEYIARFIQRFGYGAVKGSSTRGGKGALIQMIRQVRGGKSAAFTVDGPRGPIYEAKPGAVLLAAKSNALIVPFSISLNRYWQLPSWDKIQIPKPFARAIVVIGNPIQVPDDSETHEYKHQELQAGLEQLREQSDSLVTLKS